MEGIFIILECPSDYQGGKKCLTLTLHPQLYKVSFHFLFFRPVCQVPLWYTEIIKKSQEDSWCYRSAEHLFTIFLPSLCSIWITSFKNNCLWSLQEQASGVFKFRQSSPYEFMFFALLCTWRHSLGASKVVKAFTARAVHFCSTLRAQ